MARDPVYRQDAPGYLGMVRETQSLRVIVAQGFDGAAYYRLQTKGPVVKMTDPGWVPVAASSSPTTPSAEATEFTPATPGSTWLQVTLREGRTRQIHRMAEATGLFVMRLARIAFAGITSDGLRPGQWRNLSDKEVTALRVRYLLSLIHISEPTRPY